MAMSASPAPQPTISSRKLWFGLATSAIAWTALGCLDIVVNWRACMHQEEYGVAGPNPVGRVVIGLLAVVLLMVSVWSGIVSYRNWKLLSAQKTFLEAQAVERREFMAVLGVIITITLGMGIIWLGLPPLFLDICSRAK
jgi:hypothetical protein